MILTLEGLTVLNTRPRTQAENLTKDIIALGGKVIVCPALEIVPLPWHLSLLPLNHYDIAIFTSVNAVNYFFAGQADFKNSTITFVAIGKSTARALEEHGISVHSLPSLANSEALLSLPLFKEVKNKFILLVKGKEGRDLIPATLKNAGAFVNELAVYERRLPDYCESDLEQIWHNAAIDIILLTSETAIKNLRIMFIDKAFEWLQRTPCLVISQRLADIASNLGFKQIFITQPDTLIQGLIEARGKLASY